MDNRGVRNQRFKKSGRGRKRGKKGEIKKGRKREQVRRGMRKVGKGESMEGER